MYGIQINYWTASRKNTLHASHGSEAWWTNLAIYDFNKNHFDNLEICFSKHF